MRGAEPASPVRTTSLALPDARVRRASVLDPAGTVSRRSKNSSRSARPSQSKSACAEARLSPTGDKLGVGRGLDGAVGVGTGVARLPASPPSGLLGAGFAAGF